MLFTPSDYTGTGSGEVEITVHNNATGSDIAQALHKAEVVASTEVFIEAFNSNPSSTSIQPGVYKLKKHMSATNAVAALLNPKNKIDLKITIPEGFTIEQVVQRLVKVGGYKESDVRSTLADSKAIGLPSVANGNPEGWLAPKTYTIYPDTSLQDVIKSMVQVTVKTLTDLNIPENKWQEILTIGSIIEHEVNQEKYYPMVARVILNRISDTEAETRGLLQMDSTVQYGLGRNGGIPSKADLKQDTAYNTYLHKGLPPTPIGAVSEAAIESATNPADGSWLYFVTVDLNTGETLFASTLEEQNNNTAKLNEFCKKNPDVCK